LYDIKIDVNLGMSIKRKGQPVQIAKSELLAFAFYSAGWQRGRMHWSVKPAAVPVHRHGDNLRAALALHFAYYNLCRVHGSLRITPAMAANITDRVWEIPDLIGVSPL
jgi:hypothetical protein